MRTLCPCFIAAPLWLTSCRYAVELTSPGEAASSQVRCAGLGISWLDFTRASSARPPKFVSKPQIRDLTGGEDVDIVFEHPGRETFGASVYVAKRGGTIVTCASTSGYWHEYDNRYLWMTLKRIVGSHFANYRESWEANRLISRGAIHPTLSRVYSLADTGQAAYDVHRNLHQGKVGVLCLAPAEGLGVTDAALRAEHLDKINLFREN